MAGERQGQPLQHALSASDRRVVPTTPTVPLRGRREQLRCELAILDIRLGWTEMVTVSAANEWKKKSEAGRGVIPFSPALTAS